MYTEIYRGLIEILTKRGEEGYENLDDTKDIAKILSLNLNFDPLNIFAVREVELDGMPNIVFVLAAPPTGGEKDFYTDYIMYRGKLVKVIMINAFAITQKESTSLVYNTIAMVCREACLMIFHHYKSLIELVPERCYTISTVGVYAQSILFVKTMDSYIGYSDLDEEAKKDHDFYTTIAIYRVNNVDPDMCTKYDELAIDKNTVVNTIRKAINQVGLYMLLDNSIWMATNNDAYPMSRFLDLLIRDDEEDND